ncbi:MAG: hypothetical protein GXY07_16785, partial [Candidatus Hydrogenedentes bacterium]|nr:hypothetical protein [Candidatus Hydrogenedentota bacterium]
MNKNNNPGVATSFALLITMLASFAFADGADWESQPIGELVDALSAMTGGQDQQLALQKVIVRKKEALPVVTGKLQSGAWFEKHMMTKLLRCSPWLETRVELECLAASETDHWLAREGAVYALAELGDASAGPAILAVLNGPETPLSVQRVAVAALARIGYTAALADLSLLTQHEDVRMRLFANRALAELGGTADKAFLLSCLGDGDFTVREDACGALAMVAGEDVAMALADRAAGDVNSAVRDAAAQALLQRRSGEQKSDGDRLNILKAGLETADRHTAIWIVKTILRECGLEGLNYVQSLALRGDYIGERARAFLVWAGESVELSVQAPERADYELPPVDDKHGEYTHTTMIDYAIAKAQAAGLPVEGDLRAPLDQNSVIWNRLHEGAAQEDSVFISATGETIRQREHAYNPLTNKGFNILGIQFGTARDRSRSIWNSDLVNAFENGDLYTEEIGGNGQLGGAWQLLGRISHLLEDMTAPLHGLAVQHVTPSCKFEETWKVSGNALNAVLEAALEEGADILYSDSPLPAEALAGLDDFSKSRLAYWFNSTAANGPIGCPNRSNDDVRGYLEVLSWISYFRTTVWGEVRFSPDGSGSEGNATSPGLSSTAVFSDVTVPAGTPNALHAMFPDKIKWRDTWNDNYFTLESANGNVFYWMKVFNTDEWGACDWSDGRCEGNMLSGGDYDDKRARAVGRFWFDTRELNLNDLVFNNYPDGTPMGKDLYYYYADSLFPLTVRYNAGLLLLANRRVSVRTASGPAAGFQLSRADNFGNGPVFDVSGEGNDFYFAAKSSVTISAPPTDDTGAAFVEWLKNGTPVTSEDGTISINTASVPIPVSGDLYTAVYASGNEGEGEVLPEGEGEVLPEGEGEVLPEGEGETPPEGEGEVPVEGEGEIVIEGEGEVPVEGEGEEPAEGEGEVSPEGEGEFLP